MTHISKQQNKHRLERDIAKFLVIALFIVLTNCNQNSQTDKQKVIELDTNKIVRLLTYGMPPAWERQGAEDVVANKWGIEFYSVAGCIVSQHLMDSVEKYNKEVGILIEKKHGKNWQSDFEKDIQKELIKQKVAYTLLEKEELIINKQKELEKEGNGFYYTFQAIDTNQYNVNATGWGMINGKGATLIYFKYVVDINKKTVKLISDSLTKEIN